MKKVLFALAAAAVALPAFTNANGPGGGKSGSPASNGQTCSSCHSGASISTQTVSISTDIPSTGFVPNTNYQITVTNSTGGASNPRSGFQASVESAGHQGSLTAGTGSKVVNTSFVTHTSSGNTVSNGQAAWTFTWNSGNAPDGTTIYVSSLFANGNNNDNGDAVATQTLALTRSTIGLDEPQLAVGISPNPANDVVTLELPEGLTVVRAFALNGAEVYRSTGVNGMRILTADWPAGTYVLDVRHADGRQFRDRIQVVH
ncbi:MAG: T9SS type A sorting domain-containing protein [Bacteroidetes bacterium]|nr:T9SS type A sorting domain-containing protein [Bacteroidota bacterium]